MYHIDYSWKNLKEKAPSWLSLKNVVGWIPWLLLFVLIWVALGQFLAFWPQLFAFLTIGVIAFFVREELVESRNNLRKILSIVESREEKGDEEIQRLLATVVKQQEDIMAVGNETRAALTELREAIATETDQAVEKIIAHVNADAATAAEIREAVQGVKNIIPDDVEETDIPTVDAPEGEPAEDADNPPADEDDTEA